MVTINIDGQTYDVPDDLNLLQACLQLGLELPYFCWHPAMGSVGSCRQCAVQQYANEEDQRGRLVMACMTPVTPGMIISLELESAKQFRETSIEVLMASHPHDCPVCEEGGECHLQDMTLKSGHTSRTYRGEKQTFLNQNLGPCIGHEMNRCINCYRCVRFYKDYAGGKDLQAMASRENVYFGRYADGTLESPFSGNLAEVCPTGVFTDKPYSQSYTRKWDLQSAPSICTHCSLGCNVSPNERYGKIKRVVSRYHDQINGYFICDRGRYGYEYSNSDTRPVDYLIKQNNGSQSQVTTTDFWSALSDSISQTAQVDLIGIGSGRASVEENQLLRTLVGQENYYAGVTDNELRQLNLMSRIYQSEAVKTASLKDIERSDAVLIIGEDLINSAPMMALSVRQASRNKSFEMAENARIPLWQDAAIRTLAQDELSPIMQLSCYPTELDEITSQSLCATPDELVLVVEGLTRQLDTGVNESGPYSELINNLHAVLLAAENPCVIAGSSLSSYPLLLATEQLVQSLYRQKNHVISTALVANQSNSQGLILGKPVAGLQRLMKQLQKTDSPKTLICLLTDLYEYEHRDVVDQLWENGHRLIVIDYLCHPTQQAADFFIPAATIVETEGTLVNNEGRAQRFFSVHDGLEQITDNWRSLVRIQMLIDPTCQSAQCQKFDDVVAACTEQEDSLLCLAEVAPNAGFERFGMKIPRQSHRYSGRTSMNAAVQIHEPKQPVEQDSALAFSMEGQPLYQASSLNVNTWSPGWNSNEALHKFQQEINGPLKESNPGLLIFDQVQAPVVPGSELQTTSEAASEPLDANQIYLVKRQHIFGTEPLSSLSLSLQGRFPTNRAQIHPNTADRFKLKDQISFYIQGDKLTVRIERNMKVPENLITILDIPDIKTHINLNLIPGVITLEVADD